jgi:hypothetical protein
LKFRNVNTRMREGAKERAFNKIINKRIYVYIRGGGRTSTPLIHKTPMVGSSPQDNPIATGLRRLQPASTWWCTHRRHPTPVFADQIPALFHLTEQGVGHSQTTDCLTTTACVWEKISDPNQRMLTHENKWLARSKHNEHCTAIPVELLLRTGTGRAIKTFEAPPTMIMRVPSDLSSTQL